MFNSKFSKDLLTQYHSGTQTRHALIGEANNALRQAKQAIFNLHRGDTKKARQELDAIHKTFAAMQKVLLKKHEELKLQGAYLAAVEEYLEAELFYQALMDKELPLFKSSLNKREWLHTNDHCRAIDLIIHKGRIGQAYNIGSGVEKNIEEIAQAVLNRLKKSDSLKIYIEDRPGHDRRYLLDTQKIREELGWEPEIEFDRGVDEVVEWYVKNEAWWRPLLGKGFVENYKKVK